ncbi:hypothetical protein [Armatimonas sp.]|uniref:hypothetical protein n=1 Tax=Armatimonas sp. TaxID=1872638 RepID=UPI0037511EF2
MSLVIDLPDSLEKHVEREAQKVGVSPSEYIVHLIQIAAVPSAMVYESQATQELFARWDEEDATMTLDEQKTSLYTFAEIEKYGIPRVRI